MLRPASPEPVLRPQMKDYRQLWQTLAPGQEMPLALRDSLDRMERAGKSLAGNSGAAKAGETDALAGRRPPAGPERARDVEAMARDLRFNNEQTARF